MDTDLFLQQLRELSLEEGQELLRTHIAAIADYGSFGVLLADEALEQLYTNPAVSLKLAELLIFFGDQSQHLPSHALGLKAKGDVLRAIGLHQAAMESLDHAGAEFLHLKDEGNWARSRISWIFSCAWLGDIEKALKEADRAREVFVQLSEYYWVYLIDINIAAIYLQKGLYLDAIALYSRMVSIYPTLREQSEISIERAIAIAQANRGEILSWLGKFALAYDLLVQAQKRFIELQETSLITHVEVRLADIDYIQGYFGSALQRYYQASDSLQENNIDDPILLAELKLKIANCLLKLNRTQEACRLAAEATAIFKQRDSSLDTADAFREYAHILAIAGKLPEAIEVLSAAETLFTQAGFNRSAFSTKLQHAEIALKLGSAMEAYEQARTAKMYFDSQGLVERSLRSCLTMATALLFSAKEMLANREDQNVLLQEATSLCRHAIHLASQHNLQEEAYRGYYLLGQLALLQGNISRAGRCYKTAIILVEQMLENLAYDLSPAFLHTVWTLYEDTVYLYVQQSRFDLAFNYLERARSTALRQYLHKSSTAQALAQKRETGNISSQNGATMLRLQQELKELQGSYRQYSTLLTNQETLTSLALDHELLEKEMKACEAKIEEIFDRLHLYELETSLVPQTSRRETSKVPSVDTTQLQRSLNQHQVLLAYFLYQEKLIIFTMSAERLTIYENPCGKVELERLLPLLYAHLQPGGWPNLQHPPQEGIRRLLKKLYALLIAPVEAALPPSPGHLIVVPYGPLHKFPFHALYDGSHFLIEDFQVNYLPASNLLTYFNKSQKQASAEARIVPTPDKMPLILGYSGHGYLQRCIDEAKTLAQILHGRCYLEKDATIARLVEQAPGSPIIHIATHGHARLDTPNFSSVVMADGQLNAIDIFNLDLRHCELATLSGCETGLSLSGGGDEQLGLGRAFLAAGARSLVISLWPVEDQATNQLMQAFYQRLLSGESKMQALRAAQCSLLHSDLPAYSHPYYWAAFRLVGDPSPLFSYAGISLAAESIY